MSQEKPTQLNRRQLLATAAAATILPSLTQASPQQSSPQPQSSRPGCLFFDVNETLLDLQAMKAGVAEALGGRDDLLPLWFTTMLQYSLVATVGDHYDEFGTIGMAALKMVAAAQGVALDESRAKAAMGLIRSLPPHPDVAPALRRLKEAGYRMVTLTNSSGAAVTDQLKNAGLSELFEANLSIDSLHLYKPHAHVYRWAAKTLDLPLEQCMLVAAHGWDVAGAQWAGWRSTFLARPGAELYPLAARPEIVEADLGQAATQLLALD